MPDAVQALAIYFGWMVGSMLLALPLAPSTLLAAKAAPPWAVALVGAAAAGLTAAFDHALITSADRLRTGDGKVARLLTRLGERARAAPVLGASSLYVRYVKAIYARVERMAKVAPFWTTGIFAGFPLPFWIVRLVMPLAGYARGRYVVAVMIGRFGRLYVIATFGTLVAIPNEILLGMIAFGVIVAVVAAIARYVKKARPAPNAGAQRAEAPVPPAAPPPTSAT